MIRWALRNLLEDRASLATSIGGVAGAFFLALFLGAVFAGEARQIVAYPQHAGADVWVMQKGVANMHMATSLVARRWEKRIAAVEGVAGVTAILYRNTFIDVGGRDWFAYVVGLPEGADRGGPWEIVAGKAHPGPGEILLPAILARRAGVGVGDPAFVSRETFRIAGLTGGTYSMANSVAFVAREDLGRIQSAPDGASYFLVEAAPETSPAVLARRLEETLGDLSALARDAFVANDREMAMQMGVQVVAVMRWIGAAVGALVVAFTIYASVIRRSRELAIAKALGAPNRALYAAIALQALAVTATGYSFAIALATASETVVPRLVPEVSLLFSWEEALRFGGFAFAVALAAALVPARRVARVDPASVFAA